MQILTFGPSPPFNFHPSGWHKATEMFLVFTTNDAKVCSGSCVAERGMEVYTCVPVDCSSVRVGDVYR